MRPTIKDIARQTGLSVATVSRALHDAESPYVSTATRERVRAVAGELGYTRNELGAALVRGKTDTIGLWTANAFTPYYSQVARSANRMAAGAGYRLAVQSVADWPAGGHPGRLSSRWEVDGILACDMALYGSAWLESLAQERSPVVEMGLHHTVDGDFVGVELYSAACDAVRHLLAPGCQRVAYLVNERSLEATDPRSRAYNDVMQEAGLQPLPIVMPVQGRAPARTAIAEHLRSGARPEAVFCINDEVAIGCYRALCEAGVRIPDDVALVGCDGLEDTEYHVPPISTIVQPVEQMVGLAWGFLQCRIDEPKGTPKQAVLTPVLAVRASSDRGSHAGARRCGPQGG